MGGGGGGVGGGGRGDNTWRWERKQARRGRRAEPSRLGWGNLSDQEGEKYCLATTAGEDESGRGVVEEAVCRGRGCKTRARTER